MAETEQSDVSADSGEEITRETVTPLPASVLYAFDAPRAEEPDDWVTTYMDLITLLLTVFIVLLAYADTTDDRGFAEVSQSIADASRGTGIIPAETTPPLPDAGREEGNSDFNRMETDLQQQFADSGLEDAVEIHQTPGKLHIQLSDKILFASGEASFNPQAISTLQPLLALLQNNLYDITVEGHTDNIPINTVRYPSNWELSAARASSVVRFLIEQGIDAGRLRAIGYADSRPIADNGNENGRGRNRRVTLVLSTGSNDESAETD